MSASQSNAPLGRASWWAGLLLATVLTGCATAPPAPPTPAPAPPQPTLSELMQAAEAAGQAGAKEKARQALRDAAKGYPTSKEPWSKLAEDYFEATDYGNAILAAQEVTQRDPQDRTAHSILAVAGLRVSSSALAALRTQQSGLPNDTRAEAQNLTRALRETLGEQVLVPRVEPAATPTANNNRRSTNRSQPRATATRTVPAAAATAQGDAPRATTGATAPAGTSSSATAPKAASTAANAMPTAAPGTARPAPPIAPTAPAKPATTATGAKPASNPFDTLR
jgi:hypothetical protein